VRKNWEIHVEIKPPGDGESFGGAVSISPSDMERSPVWEFKTMLNVIERGILRTMRDKLPVGEEES
jgi:hypothetical protein